LSVKHTFNMECWWCDISNEWTIILIIVLLDLSVLLIFSLSLCLLKKLQMDC